MGAGAPQHLGTTPHIPPLQKDLGWRQEPTTHLMQGLFWHKVSRRQVSARRDRGNHI